MFLTAASRPLVAGVLQVRASGTVFRHGWPAAKCSSKQRPRPLVAGVLQARATGAAFRHGWPAAKCSSKQRPGPWWRVCFRCGPVALCFVTVGLRPNVPHSSAPGPWGGCASGAGQWRCISLRLACGQMILKASPRPLGSGVFQVRATGTAFRHGWPSAKCSSQQRPGPWGGCVAGAGRGHCVSSRLAFGQMFLKAAPRPIARGSVSKFSTKNTPNVENTRKE